LLGGAEWCKPKSAVEFRVRYLKAALVGLVVAILLTASVLAVEMVYAEKSVSAQMADCLTSVLSDRTETVCHSTMEFGGVELALAFVVGFAAVFAWRLRRLA
jgi:hypothetical protein